MKSCEDGLQRLHLADDAAASWLKVPVMTAFTKCNEIYVTDRMIVM